MYYGLFKLVKNKKARYKAMWFCLDDNSCCVLGDVRDYVKGKLQVPKVWPIFIGTKFIQMEVASLEEARFACPCPCGGSWWESKCK